MAAISLQNTLTSLHDRLAPAEKIFFTWLTRVFLVAILVATAWIDDAPPLELAAMIIAAYVVVRVLTEFGHFVAVAPFGNRVFRVIFAIGALGLLGLSFLVVYIFVDRLALSVA